MAEQSRESTPARTGRPPLTSRAELLTAAREVGFDGLTVGQTTALAGVKYSTFYRHFPTRAALAETMVAAVVAEADLDDPHGEIGEVGEPRCRDPEEGQPEQANPEQRTPVNEVAARAMVDTTLGLAAVLAHHPGLATTLVELAWPQPPVAALIDRLADRLHGAGIAPRTAGLAAHTTAHLVVHDFALHRVADHDPEHPADRISQQVRLLAAGLPPAGQRDAKLPATG